MTQTSDPQGKAYTDGWRDAKVGTVNQDRMGDRFYAMGVCDARSKEAARRMGVKC